MEELKDRLKKILDDKNITPYRLEEKNIVKQATLGRWLKGETKPYKNTIKPLADFLGTDVDWLLNGIEKEDISKEIKRDKITGSPPPTKEEIERFFEIFILHEEFYKESEIFTDYENFIRMDERRKFLKEILIKKLHQEDD